MDDSSFGLGVLFGVAIVIIWLVLGAAIWGHTNAADVESIDMPDMYKVTVDDVDFLCKSEPVLENGYIELIRCNNMPATYLRIMNYSSFAVAEVE